jgi:thiol-disulfide isomerase/thioredoxin
MPLAIVVFVFLGLYLIYEYVWNEQCNCSKHGKLNTTSRRKSSTKSKSSSQKNRADYHKDLEANTSDNDSDSDNDNDNDNDEISPISSCDRPQPSEEKDSKTEDSTTYQAPETDKISGQQAQKLLADQRSGQLKKPLIMGFFSKRCGHCIQMKSAYEEATQRVLQEKQVLMYGLYCDDDDEAIKLARSLDIKGFPTILAFKNGQMHGSEFEGSRTSQNLYRFAQSLL